MQWLTALSVLRLTDWPRSAAGTLLSSTDNVPAVVYDDGYVVAAVGWSAWDGVAVKALATHLAHLPGPSVAVFNIDDSLPSITASRLCR